MLTNEIILYRLSIIKYIFENSKNESERPEPLCVSALLLLHDSIELFLQLAIEHHDITTTKQLSFIDYWDILKKSNLELTHKESMRRLNKSRVAFKHHGTMPSRIDINTFFSVAELFFLIIV